jgi:protoporphyrinogen oxidase
MDVIDQKPVVILGAGLTGLSAAYHFEKNNFFNFSIFEQEKKPGGLARSISHEGFTFDFTGHLIHCNNPYFKKFLNNILPERRNITRHSFAFSHNTFMPYPFQANFQNLPTQVVIECLLGFARRNHQRKNITTFREWVLKYFGAGLGKHFFFPYNSKLMQRSVDKITPSWVGRFVPKTTMIDMINGAQNLGYNSSFDYPKQGGIETLVKALKKNIDTKIQTNHKAISIDIKRKKIIFENGKTVKYSKLITTIPLNNLLKIIHEPAQLNLRKNRRHLFCTSVINFNIGYKLKNNDKKHWVYHPEKKYDFYRVGFWHNIAPQLVKNGCGALYGEISYEKNKEKTIPEKKIRRAIEQTTKIYGIKKNEIVTEKILHLENAYVIYDAWREKNLPLIHEALERQSIFSIGRYGAWKYSSMQEAILDGKKIAHQIYKESSSVGYTNLRVENVL